MLLSESATDAEIMYRLSSASRLGLQHGYTKFWPLDQAGLLCSSALFEASSGKKYRGHLGVIAAEGSLAQLAGVPSGDLVFITWTTYGKSDGDHHGTIHYSPNLDEVLSKLNKTLKAKLSPVKGYHPVTSGPETIARQDVLGGLDKMKELCYL